MNVQSPYKKECIYLSTLQLIQENGFHGAPMSQIAKHANVSVGLIYHYFPSKETMLLEMFAYCKHKIDTHIFATLHDHLTYKDQFGEVLARLVAFYIQNPPFYSFMDQFYSSPFYETQRKIRQENNIVYEKDIYSFLNQGITLGLLRNVEIELIKSVFVGTAMSFIRSSIYGKFEYHQHHIDEMIDIVWTATKSETV